MRRIAALLLLIVVMVVSGCRSNINQEQSTYAQWDGWPGFDAGKLESVQLENTTWDSGRCEATSENTVIETENGYYYVHQQYLFYADKTDMDKWVLVCSKPDCNHRSGENCGAFINGEKIVSHKGRLCTTVRSDVYPELYEKRFPGYLLISLDSRGANPQLEYVLEEAVGTNTSCHLSYLSSDHWLYYFSDFGIDGSCTGYLYKISEKGAQLIKEQKDFQGSGLYAMTGLAYGVTPFWSDMLDESGELRYFHYFDGEDMKVLDLSKLPSWGCYVSSGIARGFDHRNGYYHDVNLETGEDIKLADAQINNSFACVILPNCILESTMLRSFSVDLREAGTVNAMKLFDGVQWKDVILPEELANASANEYLEVIAVTSDRILLSLRNASTYKHQYNYPSTLCQIILTSGSLELEICGEIEMPKQVG